MKHCLHLLAFFAMMANAQVKDTRADLETVGGIIGMSVSPDEKIYLLSSAGKAYYAENIGANWHNYKPVCNGRSVLEIGCCSPNKISFLNKDTAVTGGYKYDKKGEEHFVGYWTGDGGKNWKVIDTHPGNTRINDFIEKIKSGEEIASYKENKIYLPRDNRQSYDSIPTPFDQKKYTSDKSYSEDWVSKIENWGKYIVVNQGGHVFYTEKDNIYWQSFPENVIDFELDPDAQEMFAVTRSLNVILFSTPQKYRLISKKRLINYHAPSVLQVANHALYLLVARDKMLYKVSDDTFFSTEPYTTDYKIKQPGIIKRSGKICAGAEGKSIYLSDNNGKDWYREKVVDFIIQGMHIPNDSCVILWDGNKNYLYSFHTHMLKEYVYDHPLTPFLEKPIKTFSLQVSSFGHSSGQGDKVIYTKEDNTDSFSVSVIKRERGPLESRYPDFDTFTRSKMCLWALMASLNAINNNTEAIPSIGDFNITDTDKKNYLMRVNDRLKNNSDYWPRRAIHREFYDAIPGKLDTITTESIKQVLNWDDCHSTTLNTLTLCIVNGNNDTLTFSNSNDCHASPWNLPWECSYQDIVFKCYDMSLSRFINDCKPPEYEYDKIFSNSYLMMQIADYWFNNE